jgi:hypothetical protein
LNLGGRDRRFEPSTLRKKIQSKEESFEQVLKAEAQWLGAGDERVIAAGQRRSSEAVKEAARRQENFVRETFCSSILYARNALGSESPLRH